MAEDSVGKIGLDLGINYNQFNKQLGGIADNATNMVGSAFKKLGGIVAAAFAVGKIVEFGKSSIELASNLSEVQNVVDVTFGGMAADINNWSKTMLQGFGLSELSAKKYSSTLGAMMKSSGLAGTQMEGMSKKLTELSADMASFYNLSNDDAFEKIRSGISGETEPLKQLGINMSVANMEAYALTQGIKKQYQEMTQAEQTLLRYNYLLSVSKDAQGDFARTSGSWANQVKLLGEQWKIFQGTMGAGFINILAPVIRGLNLLIQKLQIAAQYFKAFTSMLFGDASGGSVSSAADTASASTEEMRSAVSDAGKATKKAGKDVKGALSGFDQLNVLTQAAASNASDAASGMADMGNMDLGKNTDSGVTIDPSQLKPVIAIMDAFKELKIIAGEVKDFFADNFAPVISLAASQLVPVFNGWKDSIVNTLSYFKAIGEPLKQWFVGDFAVNIKTAILTVTDVFAGLLDSARKVFDGLRVEVVEPILLWFVSDGLPMISQFAEEAMHLFQTLFNSVKHIFDMLWEQGVEPGLNVVSTMVIGILDILRSFWDDWGVSIFSGLKEMITNVTGIIETFWTSFLKPIWDNILSTLSWLWEKHLKGLVKEITDFVGTLITAALDIYNKFIQPVLKFLIAELGPKWAVVFNGIIDVVGTAVAIISDVVKGIIKALRGIIDFIAGVFTADWERSWKGIKEFFGGIFDGIVGIFKGAINLIIDGLNVLIGALNTVKFDMPDWVPGIGGKEFGINIPKIPKLANGGLVSAPTLAMVGDNRNAVADPEVVSPLSKLQEMLGGSNQEVVNALMLIVELLKNINLNPVLKVGEIEFGRVAANAVNTASKQTGRQLILT
ncbi:hypothetical protein LY28_00015 [Ruminiclostridium sufflavum DSM 19573]|uniref:Phage-related protein n=1 Tax=Ruminiclostridium sufflavum DSM 19573 TaxID=1121337 RepID=A0A318XQ03_9FIRM|nr:hypothetical protein [Ruminiclostridium sufflavum]PYG90135.1 hypothetical protein LY28_00015 [Ruminiclostridium sufflavum DSM 19573]